MSEKLILEFADRLDANGITIPETLVEFEVGAAEEYDAGRFAARTDIDVFPDTSGKTLYYNSLANPMEYQGNAFTWNVDMDAESPIRKNPDEPMITIMFSEDGEQPFVMLTSDEIISGQSVKILAITEEGGGAAAPSGGVFIVKYSTPDDGQTWVCDNSNYADIREKITNDVLVVGNMMGGSWVYLYDSNMDSYVEFTNFSGIGAVSCIDLVHNSDDSIEVVTPSYG